MNKRTRTITLAALLMALSVIFLYLGNILPSIRLGLAAAASLLAVAAVIENGIVSALFVFLGSSIMSAFLLPDKTVVLIYVLFFGYYPVVKSMAERIRSNLLSWALKLAVFEAAFSLIWFVFKNLVFSERFVEINVILVYLTATLAFLVFDIGLTRLIGFYIHRISKNIQKNNH